MAQTALIIDPTRLFRKLLNQVLSNIGIECTLYSTGKEALEAQHQQYTFILVSRTLEDMTGEVFMRLFGASHTCADSVSVLLTSNDVEEIKPEAMKAGFKYVFDKKDIDSLQKVLVRVVDSRTMDLNAKVLLIEDSQSIADAVTALMRENGSSIAHFKRIKDAQTAIQATDFDLIISDYYLTDNETGAEVIQFVRNLTDQDKANTPILVVSSESNYEKRNALLKQGANDFILKPYDRDELLVRASNLITSARLLKQSRAQQRELLRMALTDQLTGLYNRHSLYDLGPKYVSNAKRNKSPMSMLVIDLDHFKKINDTHGHSTGDVVLQGIGRMLEQDCRSGDIVARFGGEEFVALLPNCDLSNAKLKAEQILAKIAALKPAGLKVTASIGTAELLPIDDFDTLFNRADAAVYRAKEGGRNRIELADVD